MVWFAVHDDAYNSDTIISIRRSEGPATYYIWARFVNGKETILDSYSDEVIRDREYNRIRDILLGIE